MPPKTILIVDDDATLRKVLSHLLQSQGYAVVTAPSVAEGAKTLEKGPVHAVLLDLVIGNDNGWDALRVFWGKYKARVILMTGTLVDGEVVKDAKLLGAHGVLQKPFANEALFAAVA